MWLCCCCLCVLTDCRLSSQMKSELSTCTVTVLSSNPKVCYPSTRTLGRLLSTVQWTTRSIRSWRYVKCKFRPHDRRLFFCCSLSTLIIHVYPLQLTFEAMFKETKLVDTRLGVEVRIKDANDNVPTFKPQTAEVSILESTKQGKETVPLFLSQHSTYICSCHGLTHVNYLCTDRNERGLTYGDRQGFGHR